MTDISDKKIFTATSEKKTVFTFEIKPRGWLDALLQRLRISPKERVIEVSPIKYGVRAQCSTYINKASFEKYSNNNVFKAGTLFAQHETDNIIMFLACVLWNREDNLPPEWLIRAIRQMDQTQIDSIIDFARESLDTEAFLHSIISMIGVSLQSEEIIAPEKESPVSIK